MMCVGLFTMGCGQDNKRPAKIPRGEVVESNKNETIGLKPELNNNEINISTTNCFWQLCPSFDPHFRTDLCALLHKLRLSVFLVQFTYIPLPIITFRGGNRLIYKSSNVCCVTRTICFDNVRYS